jgi:hypothetical protein
MESFALPVLNGERKAAILVTVDAHPLRKTIGNDFNLLRKNIRASLRWKFGLENSNNGSYWLPREHECLSHDAQTRTTTTEAPKSMLVRRVRRWEERR